MDIQHIITAILCTAMMAGCGTANEQPQTASQASASTEASDTVSETVTETTPSKPARFVDDIQPLGRTYDDGNVLWMGYSGTGAAFTMTGKTCDITFAGGSASVPKGKDCPRVAVYVDGKRVLDELIDRKEKTFNIVKDPSETTHDVRIVKLSECAQSVCGIRSIVTDGIMSPAAPKDMLIEFIGDSITCGYGVDDEDKSHHFSTATEDCTKAYAMKAAEKLDADASLVCLSGHGIISGYCDGNTQQKDQIMPKYYDKFGSSWSTFGDNAIKPASIEWDHHVHPDVVVINLGTNDASWTGGKEDRLADYQAKYSEFIRHIRDVHPDAYIVCTLGIMGDALYPYVEAAAEDVIHDTGDKKILTMKFDVQSSADGYAADWHPTEATHEKAAEKLAAFIKANCV